VEVLTRILFDYLSYRLLRQNLHEQGTRLALLSSAAIVFFSAALNKGHFLFFCRQGKKLPHSLVRHCFAKAKELYP
jgi:hypothetical protein